MLKHNITDDTMIRPHRKEPLKLKEVVNNEQNHNKADTDHWIIAG